MHELLEASQNPGPINVDELVERLRPMAQEHVPWEPNEPDPFSFSATIIQDHQQDSDLRLYAESWTVGAKRTRSPLRFSSVRNWKVE